MRYCKIFIFCIGFLLISSIYAQDYIINEIAEGGKFIVRDTNQNESMVIENGNVGFSGTMKLDVLPQGNVSNSIVVWDAQDKLFKIIDQDLNNYLIEMFKDSENSSIESNNNHWQLKVQGIPRFTIMANNGNVGIGTADPGARLDISGQIKIRGGTPAIGKVLTSDATGLATWQKIQSSYVESNTLWTASGSNVYRDNGKVGIGTANPGAKFDVVGGTVRGGNTDGEYLEFGHGGSNAYINTVGDGRIDFRHDFNTLMSLKDNGYLGIGTSDPSQALDVNGTAQMTGFKMTTNPSKGYILTCDANGRGTWQVAETGDGGNVDGHSLDAADGSSVDVLYVNNSGNIGVGTITPQGVLDLHSSSGALIVPRMTTAQRDNLPVINGSIIYNTNSNEFNFLQDGSWFNF